MKIDAVVILIGLASSFALAAFAQEKEEVKPWNLKSRTGERFYANPQEAGRH